MTQLRPETQLPSLRVNIAITSSGGTSCVGEVLGGSIEGGIKTLDIRDCIKPEIGKIKE